MRKIKCVAIDDEPIALLVIQQFCERRGDMEITTFCDPRIGLEEIMRTRPDLVFLDIEMNGLNGLDVAKSLAFGMYPYLHYRTCQIRTGRLQSGRRGFPA